MIKKVTLLTSLIVICLLFNAQTANAQFEAPLFFSDTGHWLLGQFYDFYMDYENAEIIFGSPITDEFYDDLSGRIVQYFEYVRFELHLENPPGHQVIITELGNILYQPGMPIELNPFTPNCRQALGWSFPVCFSFLDFYHANGGRARFGKPLSGMEFTKGRLTQHFEFAQMIWNPDHPNGARVTLAPLGQHYFYIIGEDNSRLEPDRTPQYSMSISELNVRSFTRHAMVSRDDTQTLYVTVKDQNSASVIGARVTLTIHFPNGRSETFSTVATNELGLTEISFQVDSMQLGLAEMTISVDYGSLHEISINSFRIWY
jgi:hypothetical protein